MLVTGHKPIGFSGLIHSFQQDRMREAWNTDFPKIKSEGGSPGSAEAGLVAFLRERLIDMDALDEDDDESDDEEEQCQDTAEIQAKYKPVQFQDVNTTSLVFPVGYQHSQAEAEWSQFERSASISAARR